jgi:uncharacterized protein YjeT (DUF2065 family)
MLGGIGLVVMIAPDLWSGLFTSDHAVRATANQYLRLAGPGFLFVGVGLSLYFASQGSGKVLAPVLAGTVRLGVIAVGGWWLTASEAPAWSLFALVGASMTAFGLCVAAAVYLTPWGIRATLTPIEVRVEPPVSDRRSMPKTGSPHLAVRAFKHGPNGAAHHLQGGPSDEPDPLNVAPRRNVPKRRLYGRRDKHLRP